METLEAAGKKLFQGIDFVLTDVDDTLTSGGRLRATTMDALEKLRHAGIRVIPVTAASAGWCSLIAHMWPVDAVIGENGGLYFAPDQSGLIERRYWSAPDSGLPRAAAEALRRHPNLALADDQSYRETTLAFRRPVAANLAAVVRTLSDLGMQTVVNSMWLLGWRGEFDKLSMAGRLLREIYDITPEAARKRVLYVGDSENDQPMFRHFPQSVGVSTVVDHRLDHWPKWITSAPGGEGFVEVADKLLAAR